MSPTKELTYHDTYVVTTEQATSTSRNAGPESLVLTTRGSPTFAYSNMIYGSQTLSSYDGSIARDHSTSRFGGVV